jgi:hypothetical protein
MNILDENILSDQRQMLQIRRIAVHQIGDDIGRKGMQDEEIIPLLHQLTHPTFFTRDGDFLPASSLSFPILSCIP